MFAYIFGSANRRRVEAEIAKNLDNRNETITFKVVKSKMVQCSVKAKLQEGQRTSVYSKQGNSSNFSEHIIELKAKAMN